MIAYIQKQKGEFPSINNLTAYLGFQQKGYEMRCFEAPDLDQLPIDRECIVAGGIQTVSRALLALGITPPELPCIPPELATFAGRKIWQGTMGEAEAEIQAGRMIFVKPIASDRKLFNGAPFRVFRDTIRTAHIPHDHPVMLSDIVNFDTEYRVFVLDGDILGIRHYSGDCKVFPDPTVIEAAIAAFQSAPAGYGIDFGVTDTGKTLLVEINEGYSLGCYGLPPILYSTLLERRWEQILQQNPDKS